VPANPSVWLKVAVGLGRHACALKRDGRAFCWGDGELGQLGYAAPKLCDQTGNSGGDRVCSWIPQEVQCSWGPCLFKDISAGVQHTCALDVNDVAWCWGNNATGALGVGTYSPREEPGITVPHAVVGQGPGQLQFRSIHAGFDTTCAVSTGNQVYCWGDNRSGIVPGTSDRYVYEPVRVDVSSLPVDTMDNAYSHACARTAPGELFCWGTNRNDELGAEAAFMPAPTCATCPAQPVRMQDSVPELKGQVVRLATTGNHGSCAHLASDVTTCWGLAVPAHTDIVPLTHLSRGFSHYCAITHGTLRCAGLGALGDGIEVIFDPGAGPVRVGKPPDYFRDVDTGHRATCGIGTDELVYCWGSQTYGKLGIGYSRDVVTTPAPLLMPTTLKPLDPEISQRARVR
jgi:alpha-tubulin suppressor-like RCC1 family protein